MDWLVVRTVRAGINLLPQHLALGIADAWRACAAAAVVLPWFVGVLLANPAKSLAHGTARSIRLRTHARDWQRTCRTARYPVSRFACETVHSYSMEFDVYRVRRDGNLLPRHVMWSNRVRGDLYVIEVHDDELKRTVKVAKVIAPDAGTADPGLVPPLLDATLVSAKPDWWTMTGWERIANSDKVSPQAFQQSWILVPADMA
jgi:hypothetical protein